jgi:hypothetical protein
MATARETARILAVDGSGLKEILMNPIQCVRRFAGVLAGLACALVALVVAAPASIASVPPPGIRPITRVDAPAAPVINQTVVAGGMPGWQIAAIAVGAAVLAAIAAVLLDRARIARRHPVSAVT